MVKESIEKLSETSSSFEAGKKDKRKGVEFMYLEGKRSVAHLD